MFNEFIPVPKPERQEKKKKTGLKKIKPYNRKTIQPKKKKAPKKKSVISAERSGIKPPSIKVRNSFSEEQYKKAIDMFGTTCNDPVCSMPASEMHHIIYRSQSGRGVWRNAVPLCISHHEKCHKHRAYSEMWRESRRRTYGQYFHMDKWDLWLNGLIADPTTQFYEDYMKNQEVNMKHETKVHGT